MSENDGFGWSDKAEVPETGYALLPKGPAVFVITKLDRQRKEFGKFGVQNVAVMTFSCQSKDGGDATVEVQVQFALVKALGWKIVQLATACGFRKHGDSSEVDPRWWARFENATGECLVDVREYETKKGKKGKANEITEFVAPEAAPAGKPDDLAF